MSQYVPQKKASGLSLNYVYASRTSGSDNFFGVADQSGNLFETSGNLITIANSFNLVNNLFTNINNVGYLDVYNVIPGVNKSLTVNAVPSNASNISFSTDLSKNSVSFNKPLSDFSLNSVVTMSVYSQGVPQLTPARDFSNNLVIKTKAFGLAVDSNKKTFNMSATPVNGKFTFDIAALTSSAKLLIQSDLASLGISGYPKPNYDVQDILTSLGTDLSLNVGAGIKTVDVNFTVPASIEGTWKWTAKIVDGSYTSAPISIQIESIPVYGEPTFSVPSVLSADISKGTVVITRNSSDASDISNYPLTSAGLAYDFRIIPGAQMDVAAINSVFNGISFVNRDVSSTPRTLIELTGSFKLSDISRAIEFSFNAANEYMLNTKSFRLYLDWANRAQGDVYTLSKLINIDTKYTSNVNVINNLNGTYTLSYTQTVLPTGSKFYVKYFDSNSNAIGSQQVFDPSLNLNTMTKTFTPIVPGGATIMRVYVGDATNAFIYTVSLDSAVSSVLTPKLVVKSLTGGSNTFVAINANQISFLKEDVSGDDILILDQLNSPDVSGYYVNNFDQGIDISASVLLPTWFSTVTNSSVTYTITDNNSCLTGFTVSGTKTDISSTKYSVSSSPSGKTHVLTLSNKDQYNDMEIDLIFKPVVSTCVLQLDVTLDGYVNGNYKLFDNQTVLYYVPVGASSNSSGGNYNTLVVHNGIKLSFDAPGVNMNITEDDISYNIFRNLGTSVLNRYNINLVRSEFIPDSQSLIYDGIKVTATSMATGTPVANSTPRIYFSFANTANIVDTVTACSGIDNGFCTLNFSFIQLNNFVGYIDIDYFTSKNAKVSKFSNRLRIVSIPRPNLSLVVNDLSANLLPKSKASYTYNVSNYQTVGGARLDINTNWPVASLDVNGNSIVDVSGNYKLKTLINTTYLPLTCTSGNYIIDSSYNVFDICQNTIATSLAYGATSMGFINFNGVDTSKNLVINGNLNTQYTQYGVSTKQKLTAPFTVNILTSNGTTIYDNVRANCLFVNKCIKLNTVEFAKYIMLDYTTTSYSLDISGNCAPALFTVIKNISGGSASANISVTWNGQGGSSIILPGDTWVFYRTSNIPGGWSSYKI